MSPFGIYFQDVRNALHFAIKNNSLKILDHIHQNYEIRLVEPVPVFLLPKLIESSDEIGQFFCETINFENYPLDLNCPFLNQIRQKTDCLEGIVKSIKSDWGKENI